MPAGPVNCPQIARCAIDLQRIRVPKSGDCRRVGVETCLSQDCVNDMLEAAARIAIVQLLKRPLLVFECCCRSKIV